jgi:hypothetical protein
VGFGAHVAVAQAKDSDRDPEVGLDDRAHACAHWSAAHGLADEHLRAVINQMIISLAVGTVRPRVAPSVLEGSDPRSAMASSVGPPPTALKVLAASRPRERGRGQVVPQRPRPEHATDPWPRPPTPGSSWGWRSGHRPTPHLPLFPGSTQEARNVIGH